MKKDRNCNSNYPVYPTYPMNMMPGVPPMGGMMYPFDAPNTYNYTTNYNQTGSTLEQQVASLNNQISNLERRISNLENLVGNNSNKYNTSNFQML